MRPQDLILFMGKITSKYYISDSASPLDLEVRPLKT
jgi:hypothetical protein